MSLNDKLLDLSYQATSVRGTYYVPMSCFTTFGLYYSHFSESNSATLFTAEKQIYFEMTSGNTYDEDGNYYSASAIYRGGVVYAPVSFVCTQFGLNWSFIAGEGYGDILRIVDGTAVLGNREFLSAASSLMQSRYNQYHSTQSPATESPGTTPPATPTDDPGSHADSPVYLSFVGLPDEETLGVLERYQYKACFFLTAEDVKTAPDAVRHITGKGHSLGVFCAEDPAAEYDEVSDLIFEAARTVPLLITSAPADRETVSAAAAEHSLIYVDYTIDAWLNHQGPTRASQITGVLESVTGRAHILFANNFSTAKIVADTCDYLTRMHFGVLPVRETGY